MINRTIRLFHLVSATAALTLTLGLGGWASAQSAASVPVGRVAAQAATPAETATPIDPDQPVALTPRKAFISPLDNDQIPHRNFTFKGKANELVTVGVQLLTGNLSFKLYVNNQAGDEIGYGEGTFVTAMTLTVKLPQDGNYQLEVKSADPGAGDFAAGTFSITVGDAPAGTATPSK
ncbi:MAG: hypothetical protein ACYDBJ_12840 [Aggregatilineales bacterium]